MFMLTMYVQMYGSAQATSFSSMTSESTSTPLNIKTVTLNLEQSGFLGISIIGQNNRRPDGSCDRGIYVGSVMKGGAVAQDGQIAPGDMILEVNGMRCAWLTTSTTHTSRARARARHGPPCPGTHAQLSQLITSNN